MGENNMENIKGEITYIRELKREDVDLMQDWGMHKDPLFYCYNFPNMSKSQKDYWYRNKKVWFFKKCFVVFNNYNQLIGYISLRKIKIFRRTSEMGIVFDPNHIEQGYGTDGLRAFLNYYFGELRMKILYLKVAIFNVRAQKCYEKAGFKLLNIVTEEFEDQNLPVFQNDLLTPYRHFFKLDDNKLKCQFINMVITKEMYNNRG